MNRKPPFRQISIVGLGLIGGSLGMALRQRRAAERVIGIARQGKSSTVELAKQRKAIDQGFTHLSPEIVDASDLIVIAAPPKVVVGLVQKVGSLAKHPVIVTDVASIKGEIVGAVEESSPTNIIFVGSHPIAGKESSGIGAADSKLFNGAACVVTKTPRTPEWAIDVVSDLWKIVGGRVVVLSPNSHDAFVAQISHLPHLIAAALVRVTDKNALKLAGSGFADTTRVALGNPELWKEIFSGNRASVIASIDKLIPYIDNLLSNLKLLKRNINNSYRRDAIRHILKELQTAQQQRKRFEIIRRQVHQKQESIHELIQESIDRHNKVRQEAIRELIRESINRHK